MYSGVVKKIGISVFANIFGLTASLIVAFVVPKILGNKVDQFGYFQLFLLYESFVGFFHFGILDGLYLRDGGKDYDELPKSVYAGQFWSLVSFELLIAICILAFGTFSSSTEYRFILACIGISVFIYIPANMLQFVLQATNRIREASISIIINHAIFVLLIFGGYILKEPSFEYFVISYLISKVGLLISVVYFCVDIVKSKPSSLIKGVHICIDDFKIGYNLLIANVIGLLINGIVRLEIQDNWDISTFGIVSFSLNIANMVLVMINAVSVVFFPMFRRISEERRIKYFRMIEDSLLVLLFFFLIFYYPIYIVLDAWLPVYSESFRYAAILFPMCIFASKTNLLLTTYMKVYRMEKQIKTLNIYTLIFSVITSAFSIYILNSITLAVFTILLSQVFRCYASEYVLHHKLSLGSYRIIIIELIMVLLFIWANWFVSGWTGFMFYLIGFTFVVYMQKEQIYQFYSMYKLIKQK